MPLINVGSQTDFQTSKASKQRMDALRRKMSNAPGSNVPEHIPGAFAFVGEYLLGLT